MGLGKFTTVVRFWSHVASMQRCLTGRACSEFGRKGLELMRGQRVEFGGWRRWAKGFEGVTMLPGQGAGVKAGLAGAVLAFRGCMPEDAGDEVGGRQGEVFAFGVAVVEVGKGHSVLGVV